MASSFNLEGHVAFITGSTRGIGRATAELLARAGATTIVNGRDGEAAERVAHELAEAHAVETMAAPGNMADPKTVQEVYLRVFKTFKRLDVLVNNAGILDDAFLGMIPDVAVRSTFAINAESVIYNMQQAARLMQRARSGSIINLTSIIGRVGNEGQTVYGASKAAVIGATLSAAKELAPKGIRVNAVAPGFIDTDMTQSLPEDKYEERVASIKMGRIGTPEDIANVVLFLATDLSSYVTGQVIGVDGGMLI